MTWQAPLRSARGAAAQTALSIANAIATRARQIYLVCRRCYASERLKRLTLDGCLQVSASAGFQKAIGCYDTDTAALLWKFCPAEKCLSVFGRAKVQHELLDQLRSSIVLAVFFLRKIQRPRFGFANVLCRKGSSNSHCNSILQLHSDHCIWGGLINCAELLLTLFKAFESKDRERSPMFGDHMHPAEGA